MATARVQFQGMCSDHEFKEYSFLSDQPKPRARKSSPPASVRLPLDQVLHGDCIEILRRLPDKCVDLVFADPPYNLQLRADLWRPDMSKVDAVTDAWDKFTSLAAYDTFTREWLTECRRVLKDTGALWTIGSYHNIFRIGTILQDLEYWILNDVSWIKCLSANTKIYVKTARGERPMMIKDMFESDPSNFQLWNGEQWTQVLGWQQSKSEQGVEVELRSGEKLRCTPIHQWPTQRGLVTAEELRAGDVLSACQLPEPSNPVPSNYLDDEMVGWFVGLYLAEGSRFEGTISIAGHTKETECFARLCHIANMYHGQCTWQAVRGNGCQIHVHGPILNAFLDLYISGNTAKRKFLSPNCWQRSNCFLKAVLDGYLSGDGHFDAPNNRWRLGFTQNYALEVSLRTLCARTGAQIRLRDGRTRCEDREYPMLRGEIRYHSSQHHAAHPNTEVVRIGKADAEQYVDIAVADEPHLFALASGVLTHNSNPTPQMRGTRFCNAHETLIWAKKSEKQKKYTFHYHALKAGNEDRQMRSDWYLPICTGGERETRNGRKAHPTQKPESLLRRVIGATSNPGDVILDPFCGTGTTAAVAKSLGRHYITIDREETYVGLAEKRLASVSPALLEEQFMLPESRTPRIPFVSFVESDRIPAGTVIRLKGTTVTALVYSDGTIGVGDVRGSIHKVGAHCLAVPTCNGWLSWLYIDRETGEERPLDVLRRQSSE